MTYRHKISAFALSKLVYNQVKRHKVFFKKQINKGHLSKSKEIIKELTSFA